MKTWTIVILLFACVAFSSSNPHDSVLLKDVTALTFTDGLYTAGRRASPVLQLRRIGGNAPYKYNPKSVFCENVGWDGSDVVWKCQAQLQPGCELTFTRVGCEGYSEPDDPYILKGSCGLEYEMTYTGPSHSDRDRSNDYVDYSSSSSSGVGSVIFFFIFLAIAIWMCSACCSRARNVQVHQIPEPGERPPPYNPAYAASPMYTTTTTHYTNSPPGFFSGLFTGGALGYVAGRQSAPTTTHSYWSGPSHSSTTHHESKASHTSTSYASTSRR